MQKKLQKVLNPSLGLKFSAAIYINFVDPKTPKPQNPLVIINEFKNNYITDIAAITL